MEVSWAVINQQLSNREIAAAFWWTLLLLWMLYYKPARKHLLAAVKVILRPKFILVIVLLVLYISIIVLVLRDISVWSVESNLKDTVIWVIAGAFVMVLNTSAVAEEGFLRRKVLDFLKLAVVVEFVVAEYTFSLPFELALIPLLVILVGMLAVAETQNEYVIIVKPLRWLLALAGGALLLYSLRQLWLGWNEFATLARLVEFLLPSILTVLFLPFVYFLALYSAYEDVFVRLEIWNTDKQLIGLAKRRIFFSFGLNLRKLALWAKQTPRLKVSNLDEVLTLTEMHSS